MRVRVAYTVNVSDDYRRAINVHHGKGGLATRAEVQEWLWQYGASMDDDLMRELDEDEAA